MHFKLGQVFGYIVVVLTLGFYYIRTDEFRGKQYFFNA